MSAWHRPGRPPRVAVNETVLTVPLKRTATKVSILLGMKPAEVVPWTGIVFIDHTLPDGHVGRVDVGLLPLRADGHVRRATAHILIR